MKCNRTAVLSFWVVAWAFFLVVPLNAAEIVSPAPDAPLEAAPSFAWTDDGPAYAVEFSLDGFASVFYSTAAAGVSLAAPGYDLPEAFWEYLKAAESFQVRVRTLDRAGETAVLGPAAAFSPAGAVRRSANARAAASFLEGFALPRKASQADLDRGYIADELLARLPEAMENLPDLPDTVAFPIERVETALGAVFYRLQTAPGVDAVDALDSMGVQRGRLRTPGGPLQMEPHLLFTPAVTVTDPGLAEYQYAPQLMGADQAWAADITGAGVTIAILDTGVRTTHAEFDGAGKLILGPDFGENDADPNDPQGHGTHVAGIAAAEDDGAGSVGIAPDAAILAVKVFTDAGGAATLSIVEGIHYAAAAGARVINMSLGSSNVFQFLPGTYEYGYGYGGIYTQAITEAVDRGTVVVTSAGNDQTNLNGFPRGAGGAISVVATRGDDSIAAFSSHGGYVSVSAPGNEIYAPDWRSDTGYRSISGTSMAAPAVAGAAALLLQQNPGWTPVQVKERLESTAADLGASGFDLVFGHGRVDVAAALGLSSADTMPARVIALEADSTKLTIKFSKDMLADGSANSVTNANNYVGHSAAMNAFYNTGSFSYDDTGYLLTVENTTNTITDSEGYAFVTVNVEDATGIPMNGNYHNGMGSSSSGFVPEFTTSPTHFRFSNYTGSSDDNYSGRYAHVTATDDGVVQVYFHKPVTAATAEDPTNYTFMLNPTYQENGGDSKYDFLAGAVQGGTLVDLSTGGISLSYNQTSQSLTISGLSLSAGDTYGLALGASILNARLDNPLRSDLYKIYGVVEESLSTTPSVVSVDTALDMFNYCGEIVQVSFSRNMDLADVTDPANYDLVVNGSTVDLTGKAILYDPGVRQSYILGVDMYAADGQPLSVTVNNVSTVDGDPLAAPHNTASGTVSASGYNFGVTHIVAGPNAIRVFFDYYHKLDETGAETIGNYQLESPTGISQSLAGCVALYDEPSNSVLIKRSDNADFLTGGQTLTVNTSGLTSAYVGHSVTTTSGSGIVGGQAITTSPDSDGDGVDDVLDECPDDPNKATPGDCGCGVADIDTDSDGTADCIDGCPTNDQLTSPATWYRDLDGDGQGDSAVTTQDCSQPAGYVGNDTDCDDNDADEFDGQVWYKDLDDDQYSDGQTQTACERPAGYKVPSELIATSGDKDDSNPDCALNCGGVIPATNLLLME